MAVLGINCACRWTNVGVADGGAVLAETNRELARRQSELLPSMAEETLAAAGLALGDISLVALGTGPGYYTGIRAGIAYGAALARALGVKAVPLSSLELFVWDLREEYELLAPVFRARVALLRGALPIARRRAERDYRAVLHPRRGICREARLISACCGSVAGPRTISDAVRMRMPPRVARERLWWGMRAHGRRARLACRRAGDDTRNVSARAGHRAYKFIKYFQYS